jgi:hypothetical protein
MGETQPALLLITTVDLGNGEQDQIELHEGEQPHDAAQKFCEAHGLPEAVVQPLVQHILSSLELSMVSQQEETGRRLGACVGQQCQQQWSNIYPPGVCLAPCLPTIVIITAA